jgi:thiol-disulfide isomerase/thioredoxin
MNTAARILLTTTLWLIALPAPALNDASLATQQMQRIDEPAPDFVLHNAADTELHLAALRGHPVIVHFWATWCDSCRKELPVIQALAHRLAGSDVRFLAVAIDTDTGAADIDRYAASLGVDLPVFRAADGNITDRYWAHGIPVTYLIDRDGAIAGRAIGPRDWTSDAMVSLIEQFVAH